MNTKHPIKTILPLAAVAGLVLALAPTAQASVYSTAILADNPLAYYQFNETSGTDATDSTTNGNNGTYVDGMSLGNTSLATLGTAVGFDSTTNHVAVPDMGPLSEITFEVWLKPTTYPGLGGIYATTWGTGVQLFLKPTGDLHNAFLGLNPKEISYDTDVPLDSWTHVVTTMDLSDGGATILYINGTQFNATNRSNPHDPLKETATAGMIGADPAFGGRLYEGYMDEFAIYGSVLTPEQVLAHYNATIPEPATLSITSITSVGGGDWELTLKGEPSTAYEFYSSPTLDFNPGDLVPLMVSGNPQTDVTTDGSGDATVQMTLTGLANFVRAVGP
jgi:hypothetical protein